MCGLVPAAGSGDAAAALMTVSLSRQERGLLKMHLVPQTSSARAGALVIADMYGTGVAISNKLQVTRNS